MLRPFHSKPKCGRLGDARGEVIRNHPLVTMKNDTWCLYRNATATDALFVTLQQSGGGTNSAVPHANTYHIKLLTTTSIISTWAATPLQSYRLLGNSRFLYRFLWFLGDFWHTLLTQPINLLCSCQKWDFSPFSLPAGFVHPGFICTQLFCLFVFMCRWTSVHLLCRHRIQTDPQAERRASEDPPLNVERDFVVRGKQSRDLWPCAVQQTTGECTVVRWAELLCSIETTFIFVC